MRLAHLSDFHYTKLTINPLRLFPKRIFSHIHWLMHRADSFSCKPLEKLPDLFRLLNVDLVLLGGDFTSTSMPEEFKTAKDFVQTLEKPWIAIPGNHDHYTRRSYRNQMYYQHFANENSSFYSLQKDGIECQKIAPRWWVISLDTCLPTRITSSQGVFSEEIESKLEGVLSLIPLDENVILFNHYPFFDQEDKKRTLLRGRSLENLLQRHPKIRLYLHGHTHRHSIANLQPNGLPLVLDSGSCSQTKGGTWNLIDLKEEGCSVDSYQFDLEWKKKDTQEFVWKQ